MHSSFFRYIGSSLFPIILILAVQFAADADSLTGEEASVSILYYESIRLTTSPETAKPTGTTAAIDNRATVLFDAFGRRFQLLTDEILAVNGTKYTRWSGRLAGLPGSWFRFLRDDEELSGLINDGSDLYFIEPMNRVRELLVEAPVDSASPNVIFRLADILVPPGLLACATRDDKTPANGRVDGQTEFAKLSAELQAAADSALLTDSPLLQVGVVADQSFYAFHGQETENEITLIFNDVQAIYTNEVGLDIEIDSVFTVTPDTINPFSETEVAGDLLSELAEWRRVNQRKIDHTHMLTRKLLVNDSGDSLAGISYLGSPGTSGVCNPVTGASLSRDIRGLTAVIVAHEIGHNLGAPHDGDPLGACADTAADEYIMSSRVSRRTSQTFSDCSLEQFDRVIASASCLNPTAETVSTPDSGNGGGGNALGWLSIPGLLAGLYLRRGKNRFRPSPPANS